MPRPVPMLSWFERAFDELVGELGTPEPVAFRGATSYRYKERSPEQAALLKLARYVSGLSAGSLLLSQGFLQELGALQRTMDEIHEDILYICLPLLSGEQTDDHARYLNSFWEDEPEFSDFSAHQKNRDQVPRKNIRRYLARFGMADRLDHRAIATSAYLSRMYSGFVHAAAPHALELYDPDEGRFRVNDYQTSPLARDHADDFENQFFRGVFSVVVVAKVIGCHEVEQSATAMHSLMEPHFHD